MRNMTHPNEGDLYRIYTVDTHTFEIRYGYYAENERGRVEPLPIFPDFVEAPVYTETGVPVTTLLQIPCRHYQSSRSGRPDGWCGDCIHYESVQGEFGLCRCLYRKRGSTAAQRADHPEDQRNGPLNREV